MIRFLTIIARITQSKKKRKEAHVGSFTDRLKHAWNAFQGKEPLGFPYQNLGSSYGVRPDRPYLRLGGERTIIAAIYNRIAVDVAAINIQHVRLDQNDRFLEEIHSGLDDCLTVQANIDQSGRQFIEDVVISMLDEGVVALVPVDTDINPLTTNGYDILSMRVGKIQQWFPEHVQVLVYNEKTGQKQEVILPKSKVAIVENPLYTVMNSPNSTLRRLVHKLSLLDTVDEASSSGKLDMIIQLPYVIKTDARRAEAEKRRRQVEEQLSSSKYGVAYTDGTEKIVQLNRSLTNNLLDQIKYLQEQLYNQLGLTEDVLKGTGDEKVMLNYYNRTIEPILGAIADAMKRSFLTKTARTQGQSIMYFRDPFRLVPVADIAEIADKFTRNEILSSNEVRGIIGFKPVQDAAADQLRNKNIADPNAEAANTEEPPADQEELDKAMADLEDQDRQLDELSANLEQSALAHYASKYYDPVKAHEYYLRTRELKGRTSTGGLNDTGKEALTQVRAKLKEERDSTVKKTKEDTVNQIIKNSSAMQSRIDSLKKMFEGLGNQSADEQSSQKAHIKAQIAKLKAQNSEQRAALKAQQSSTIKKANADYKSKVEAETSKIANEASFKKPTKTSSRRKKS